jgi:putative endonuclease
MSNRGSRAHRTRLGASTTADVHRSQTQILPDVILSAGSVLLCKNGIQRRIYVFPPLLLSLHHGQSLANALHRNVYYEPFMSVAAAIQREKQIKGLLRIKKLALIVSMNPEWKDLSEGWYDQYRPEKCQDKYIDPSPSASRRESSGSG